MDYFEYHYLHSHDVSIILFLETLIFEATGFFNLYCQHLIANYDIFCVDPIRLDSGSHNGGICALVHRSLHGFIIEYSAN